MTTETKVTNWTVSTTTQLLDTTTLGDYDKSSVYGVRTTSGTLRLLFYTRSSSDNSYPNSNSASWFASRLQRDADEEIESREVRLRLYIDDKNVRGIIHSGQTDRRDYIEFDANLTSVSYGSNVGELVALDVAFEANGQIIRNRL